MYSARSFAASSGSIITTGVGAAGGRGTGSLATAADKAVGEGEAVGCDRIAGGGKRTDRGAVTTGGATTVEGEFERR